MTTTVDQRMVALGLANEVRSRRAELKRELKTGEEAFETLAGLFERELPAWLRSLEVVDLLRSLPRMGTVKATRVLKTCDVSSFATLGGLTLRQRRALAEKVRRSQRSSAGESVRSAA